MPERSEVIDRAVWSMQDDDVEWAALELVEHCCRRMANAQQMLGPASAVEQAAAHQTTFFIRTVRSIVMLMADAYREFWLPERSGMPVIGLSLPRWHQVQWRSYLIAELQDLLDNPVFVRNVVISTLHPDSDAGMAAEYVVLLILRLRYGMPVPEYLWEVCERGRRGGDKPNVTTEQQSRPHFWL